MHKSHNGENCYMLYNKKYHYKHEGFNNMARVDTFSQKQKPRLAKNTSLVTLSIAALTTLTISLFAEPIIRLPFPGSSDHVNGIGDVRGVENIPLEASGVTGGDESVWPQKVNVPALASTAATPAFAGIADEISGLRVSMGNLYSNAGSQLPQNMSSVMPVIDGVGVQSPSTNDGAIAGATPPFVQPDTHPIPTPPPSTGGTNPSGTDDTSGSSTSSAPGTTTNPPSNAPIAGHPPTLPLTP
jgi:hypothetical protein